MKHPYGIGLDIGIASVGWAVVALNENAEPYGLIRCGSRIFDKAEQPKTGDSLAAPRREARSARRSGLGGCAALQAPTLNEWPPPR